MRPSPAYQAVQALQKKASAASTQPLANIKNIFLPPTTQSLTDKKENQYFLIQLPATDTALTLAGASYQPTKSSPAHLSVHRHYRKAESEIQGLSVFHYTWYGDTELPNQEKEEEEEEEIEEELEQDTTHTAVVLHVFFDQKGRYVNCQLKDQKNNKEIQSILPIEKTFIRRHCQINISDSLDEILKHVHSEYQAADNSVNRLLTQLENISRYIKTQLEKYKKITKDCLDAIKTKNRWTFDDPDSRAIFLEKQLPRLKTAIKTSITTTPKQPNLYSKPSTPYKKLTVRQRKQRKKERIRARKKAAALEKKSIPKALLKTLNTIDADIKANDQNETASHTDNVLRKLELLNQKLDTLSDYPFKTTVDLEIETLCQIHQHRSLMQTLFKNKALASDLEAVKTLTPFAPYIEVHFFYDLLRKGNVEICEHMMQHFDECLIWMNYMIFTFKESHNPKEQAISLLHRVYFFPNSLPLFKMLLRNGAYPNSKMGTEYNSIQLLDLAICQGKEAYARSLLEFGADPNWSRTTLHTNLSRIGPENTERTIRKTLREQPQYTVKLDSTPPLHRAIKENSASLVSLLLKYGASVTQKDKDGLDAIAIATCCADYPPNIDIVKQLVKAGADINALQKKHHSPLTMTALGFACQRGDRKSVKSFIALGANPNQNLVILAKNLENKSNNAIRTSTTPFLRAVLKGHSEITEFLLKQIRTPITFTTYMKAFVRFFNTSLQFKQPMFFFTNNLQVGINLDYANTFPIGALLLSVQTGGIPMQSDDEIIDAEITRATQEGSQQFKNQNYGLAILSYWIVLYHGNDTQRFGACLKIALCYQSSNKPKNAIHFLELCQRNAPTAKFSESIENRIASLKEETAVQATGLALNRS